MATTRGRHRCACRRVLLEQGDAPVVEGLSTVDRLLHAVDGCSSYRLMVRAAPPDGTWTPAAVGAAR